MTDNTGDSAATKSKNSDEAILFGPKRDAFYTGVAAALYNFTPMKFKNAIHASFDVDSESISLFMEALNGFIGKL